MAGVGLTAPGVGKPLGHVSSFSATSQAGPGQVSRGKRNGGGASGHRGESSVEDAAPPLHPNSSTATDFCLPVVVRDGILTSKFLRGIFRWAALHSEPAFKFHLSFQSHVVLEATQQNTNPASSLLSQTRLSDNSSCTFNSKLMPVLLKRTCADTH